eukprot:6459283-Amphidinium_carterae.1
MPWCCLTLRGHCDCAASGEVKRKGAVLATHACTVRGKLQTVEFESFGEQHLCVRVSAPVCV